MAKLVPTFADRRCRLVSATDPYCRIFGFLDRSRFIYIPVSPQMYSRGWVDRVPDPLLLRKSGSAGNRTRASGSVARNSDHYHSTRNWYTGKVNIGSYRTKKGRRVSVQETMGIVSVSSQCSGTGLAWLGARRSFGPTCFSSFSQDMQISGGGRGRPGNKRWNGAS
jgi:hypothetical protein